MRTKESQDLQYIVSFYGLLYFIMFILPLAKGGDEIAHMGLLEKVTVAVAFLVFATGAVVSWIHEKWGGLIISFWHALVWAFALLVWTDAGMVLILIFPMIFPASFLIANWYKKNTDRFTTTHEKEKLKLQVLLSNYGTVYLLIVLVNTLPNIMDWYPKTQVDDLVVWGYTSTLGLMLLAAFFIFIIAFILSWRTNLVPGLLLIFCYLLVLYLSFSFPEFANSGPWNVFGLVLLVHGIMYLKLYFQKDKKRAEI